MSPADAGKIRLKTNVILLNEITLKSASSFVDVVLIVNSVHRWRSGKLFPRRKDLMMKFRWMKVGEGDILEAAGGNLKFVRWITPRPNAVIMIQVEVLFSDDSFE